MRPRVLMITSGLARDADDPTAASGHHVRDLVLALEPFADGTVLAPSLPDAPRTERLGSFAVKRVGPNRPAGAMHKARGIDVLRVAGVARALRAEAKRQARDHDVAHAMWAVPSGWASPADLPMIVTFPGSDVHAMLRLPVVGGVVRRVVGRAAACVAVDGLGRERLAPLSPARLEVIPVGFPIDSFPMASPTDVRSLVYTGRLSPEKNVDVLVRAIAELRAEGMEVPLSVVGDGPERDAVVGLAGSLAVTDLVTFLGAQPRGVIAARIAEAGALVLASSSEGLPASALEALAVGRPVVATRVGGLPDLLEPDAGCIVDPGDASALAWGIRKVLHGTWEPAALRSRAERYAIGHAAKRYADLYTSADHRRAA